MVGGPFFAALNGLKFPGLVEKPYLKNAALKANLICPTINVDGGVCVLLQKKDLSKSRRRSTPSKSTCAS